METVLLPADIQSIQRASELLLNNQVVAFPTETVYGLGARADSGTAIQGIFRAKGRPTDNPLIVHVASWQQLHQTVSSWTPMAERLAQAFWPGPLTLVLDKHPNISTEASAGLPTIGVRWPSHPIAQQLLLTLNVPIAAPSANVSGHPSPTTAQHVLSDLAGKIPLILDGGACNVGLESTVLDLSQGMPVLLRPGHITLQELEDVCQETVLFVNQKETTPRSPGMKYKHYAPNAPVIIVRTIDDLTMLREPQSLVLASPLTAQSLRAESVTPQTLYHLLRLADEKSYKNILIVQSEDLISQQDLWDRITRASQNEISVISP